jgi:hypothetical protein
MNAWTNRLFAAAVLTTATIVAVAPRTNAAKPETFVAKMTIDPDFPGARVLPVGSSIYTDYRLSGSDPCVEGNLYPLGTVIVLLNRKFSDLLFCNDHGTYTAREYKLVINSASACTVLGYSSPCEVVPPAINSTPQARAEAAFKNKATRTPVKFLFTMGTGIAYTITTDVDAPVIGPQNIRTVSYAGTATMAQWQGTSGYVDIASFSLPFQIVFERVALP